MQFSNYADFRNKVQVGVDGDDISTSDLSVTFLDTHIAAAEQRIYREMRSSAQDTSFSVTTTSNLAALPADFLEFRGAPYVGVNLQAVFAPYEAMINMINLGGQTGDSPVFYSYQGDSLIFYPTLKDGTTVSGRYYKRFADISTGLNAFFTRHPDVFYYGSLAELGTAMGDSRAQAWEQKYADVLIKARDQEVRRYTKGGKLQTRIA